MPRPRSPHDAAYRQWANQELAAAEEAVRRDRGVGIDDDIWESSASKIESVITSTTHLPAASDSNQRATFACWTSTSQRYNTALTRLNNIKCPHCERQQVYQALQLEEEQSYQSRRLPQGKSRHLDDSTEQAEHDTGCFEAVEARATISSLLKVALRLEEVVIQSVYTTTAVRLLCRCYSSWKHICSHSQATGYARAEHSNFVVLLHSPLMLSLLLSFDAQASERLT